MYLKYQNIRQIKTTIIGLVLIGVGLYYLLYNDAPESMIVFGMVGIGVAFVFMPDTLLDGLKNLINKNKNKEW
jgi:F0F1-type ATP synthase assembly protein I